MLTWGRQSSWLRSGSAGRDFPEPAAEAEVFALGVGETGGGGGEAWKRGEGL